MSTDMEPQPTTADLIRGQIAEAEADLAYYTRCADKARARLTAHTDSLTFHQEIMRHAQTN